MDFANTEIRELADDFRGEIAFVMWRADAGGDLGDEIGWPGSGGGAKGSGSGGGDPEIRALLSGMHERDPPGVAVGEKDGGAVGDINPEADARDGRQEGVGLGDGKPGVGGDFGHPVSMNLLGGGEDHASQTGFGFCPEMGTSQRGEGVLPLDANLETGDAAGESGPDPGNRVEGGKAFGDHSVTARLRWSGKPMPVPAMLDNT